MADIHYGCVDIPPGDNGKFWKPNPNIKDNDKNK